MTKSKKCLLPTYCRSTYHKMFPRHPAWDVLTLYVKVWKKYFFCQNTKCFARNCTAVSQCWWWKMILVQGSELWDASVATLNQPDFKRIVLVGAKEILNKKVSQKSTIFLPTLYLDIISHLSWQICVAEGGVVTYSVAWHQMRDVAGSKAVLSATIQRIVQRAQIYA